MVTIELKTFINSERKIVFDLSRSIDLHQDSLEDTNEKVIAGRSSGLIELGEQVTWRAKHLGVYQNLTSKITQFKYPEYFTDEMVDGAFESFSHKHSFLNKDSGTLMIDEFTFKSPLGVLGRVAEIVFLKNYMIKLLSKRNQHIKEIAESDRFKEILEL